MTSNTCQFCPGAPLSTLLDFGRQPLTNRFLTAAVADEYRYPLVLGQCRACGLIQLIGPPPAEEIKSRFDWISYNEPEGHLDDLAQRLVRLPGIGPDSVTLGITYKEETTLSRLSRLGLKQMRRIELVDDLGIADRCAGLETIQQRLVPELSDRWTQRHGRADIVLARHILEHAQSTPAFVAAIKRLVKPRGYIVFEVPDCTRSLDRLDYSMPWEEHVDYFTPATFRHALESQGFSIVASMNYEYSHENSLVTICQVAAGANPAQPVDRAEWRRGDEYARAFVRVQSECREYLRDARRRVGKIAVLGAGHLAAMFINVLQLGELIEFVVDDNPHKQGLLMPGARLPILPTSALLERGIKVCLQSVNPELEAQVRERNRPFVEQGGILLSLFADVPARVPLTAAV